MPFLRHTPGPPSADAEDLDAGSAKAAAERLKAIPRDFDALHTLG